MSSDNSENSSTHDSVEDDDDIQPKRKRKRKTRKQEDRQKIATAEQPSVYSSAEIRRHEKRLKRLKALEQGFGSEVETESESENVDPDLDINLRIFESSASPENLIIGEIQCNLKADDTTAATDSNERGNKNSSVFKVSVNAQFGENPSKNVENGKETDEEKTDDDIEKELDSILSTDSHGEFTEDDSDFEILMSKPIVRYSQISHLIVYTQFVDTLFLDVL